MEKRGISLTVEGINIVGELSLPEEGGGALPALCICHGIPSGKPADPTDGGYPLLAEKFCTAGFITLIFNFRGTGVSEGNFDIMGWVKDLEAAIDYLCSCPEVDTSHLCLMGFSGGAVVSAYVAARDPRISKVVLCACPAEFRDLTDQGWWKPQIDHFRRIGIIRDKSFPHSVDHWLKGFNHTAPLHWIDQIAPRPLLILQGEEDDLVEVSQAWCLYEKAREPKEIAIIKGGGHKLRLSQEAMDTALSWLKKGLD